VGCASLESNDADADVYSELRQKLMKGADLYLLSAVKPVIVEREILLAEWSKSASLLAREASDNGAGDNGAGGSVTASSTQVGCGGCGGCGGGGSSTRMKEDEEEDDEEINLIDECGLEVVKSETGKEKEARHKWLVVVGCFLNYNV
jgi:hypothetical protein